MSGIEAIGLALALWPVVGTLHDLYCSVKDSTAQRLSMTIQVQEYIFKDCVYKLLQGDESLSEKDRTGLINGDKSFEGLWQDAEFSARLESRLDRELCLLIKHEVSEISQLVKSLHKMLGDPKRTTILRNFKRVLRNDEIDKSLESLARHNTHLRRLLKTSSNTMYADARSSTSAQAPRPCAAQAARQKRIDAQFFNGFHEVLCNSFRCDCPNGHEANLSITDTLVMFPEGDLKRAMADLQRRGRSATMESDATVFGDADTEDDEMTNEWNRSTWSRTRQGSVSTGRCDHPALTIKYNQSRSVQNFSPIPDLCQWIRMLWASPPNSPGLEELQGVLGDDSSKRYTVAAPRQHRPLSLVSMEEWLTTCGTESKRRRVRAELAANLAATILQFYPTAWIDKTWTWRNFSVARGESSHSLVITQRFWSLGLPRHSLRSAPPAPSRFWSTFQDLDPMLVRLGFALIELALGKRLADIRLAKDRADEADGAAAAAAASAAAASAAAAAAARRRRSSTDSSRDIDLADYFTAVAILDSQEIEDEAGVVYQRAVEACLRCRVMTDAGMQMLTSRSSQFESDLERFVVEPLRQHHSWTWSAAPMALY